MLLRQLDIAIVRYNTEPRIQHSYCWDTTQRIQQRGYKTGDKTQLLLRYSTEGATES